MINTINTGSGFGTKIIDKLKEVDLHTEKKTGLQTFNFELPKELAFVLTIYPKAFISHFPDWLKEEFAKRTKFSFKVSTINFSVVGDNFLEETKLSYTIGGKVVLGE
jgi:hypothetical protein